MGLKYNRVQLEEGRSFVKSTEQKIYAVSAALSGMHLPPNVSSELLSEATRLINEYLAQNISGSITNLEAEYEAAERANLELIGGYTQEEIEDILYVAREYMQASYVKKEVKDALEDWINAGYDWSKTEYSWDQLCNMCASIPKKDYTMYMGYGKRLNDIYNKADEKNRENAKEIVDDRLEMNERRDIEEHVAGLLKLSYNAVLERGEKEAGRNALITLAIICQGEAGTRVNYGDSTIYHNNNPLEKMDCRGFGNFVASMVANEFDFMEVVDQKCFGYSYDVTTLMNKYGVDGKSLTKGEAQEFLKQPLMILSSARGSKFSTVAHTRVTMGTQECNGEEYCTYADVSTGGLLLHSINPQVESGARGKKITADDIINGDVTVSNMQPYIDDTVIMRTYAYKKANEIKDDNRSFNEVCCSVYDEIGRARGNALSRGDEEYRRFIESLENDIAGSGITTVADGKYNYQEGNGTPYNREMQTTTSNSTANVITQALVEDYNTGAEGS